MKFSLLSSALIGGSMVLAAPAPQEQEVRVVTEVVQYTSVVPVTTVIGEGATPTNGVSATGGRGANIDILDIVLLDENGNPLGSVANGTVNTGSGSSNPNQIGGSPGNAGAQLGTGSNGYGHDEYDYSGYPGGFDRQPGQSEDGSYGPDSGGQATEGLPSPTATGSELPSSSGTFFRLIANVTGNDTLGIRGYEVDTYHVSAGSSLAFLTSPNAGENATARGQGNERGSKGMGRTFHTNGTDDEVNNGLGTTTTSGGPLPFPESIVLVDGNDNANVGSSLLGNVYINAGAGTKGVSVQQNDNGVYVLSGAGDMGFFACANNNLPYADSITLKYLQENEVQPEQCESIVLIPECETTDNNPYTTGPVNAAQQNQIGCYFDVKNIDWSQYPQQ